MVRGVWEWDGKAMVEEPTMRAGPWVPLAGRKDMVVEEMVRAAPPAVRVCEPTIRRE